MHRPPGALPGRSRTCSRTSTTARTCPRMEYRGRRGRLGPAEAGEVDRPAVEPRREQGGQVGPVGGRAAQPVHVHRPLARTRGPSTGPVHGVRRTKTSPPRTGELLTGPRRQQVRQCGQRGRRRGGRGRGRGGGGSGHPLEGNPRPRDVRFVNSPVTSAVVMQPPRPAAVNQPAHLPPAEGCPPAAAAARRPGRLRRPGLPRRGDGRHRRPRRGEQAGALPALPGQAGALPRAARGARVGTGRAGRRGHGRHRRQPGAGRRRRRGVLRLHRRRGRGFRLVFESDLRNDDDVRSIVDRGTAAASRRSPRSSPPTRAPTPNGRCCWPRG